MSAMRVENFVDVGDPSAPIGSPAWCKASHLQLCATKRQTDLDVHYLKFGLIEFSEKERWKQLTNDKHKPFRSWEDYLTYPEPSGLGIPKESAKAIMEARDGQLIGQVLAQQLAADPAVTKAATRQEAGSKGGRGKKAVAIGHSLSSLSSNAAERIVRRLKRDHPEIAEALARGDFKSARAAGIAAGIIKPPTPLERIKKLASQLSAAERQELRHWLDGVDA